MASTFPAAIANEPPPLDVSSEDEDSEEFRSHGLKLDVPSGEPTPVSTPFKRPFNKSPDKIKPVTVEPVRTAEDLTLSVSRDVNSNSPEEAYPEENVNSNVNVVTKEIEERVNGIEDHFNEEVEEVKEENDNNTLFHEVTLQHGVDEAEETNHCDSSTKISYTNSENSQSLQLDVDIPVDVEPAAEDAICDDGYVQEISDTAKTKEEKSGVECGQTENQNSDAEVTSPEDVPEERTEEFVEFQAFETKAPIENAKTLDPVEDDKLESDYATVEPTDTAAVTVEPTQTDDFEDDDNDDFGAFQSIPHPPPPTQGVTVAGNENEEEEDDDFGDFAHNSVQAPPDKTVPTPAPKLMAQTSEEVMENFADFQDCSFQSCDAPSFVEPSTAPSDVSLITNKIDSVIKSLFVIETTPTEGESASKKPNSIDSEISVSGDSTWARVQDFEGSHGLMFKWLSSLTGKRLLRSLNINASNMVYHEKWGTIEVPKFAASLVQSPLQPQSCNRLDSQAKSIGHPAIVNNNTIISDDHDKPPISTEAQEILRQLPDLSYMRANTLVFPQSSPSGL